MFIFHCLSLVLCAKVACEMQKNAIKKIVVLIGQTASGKTEVAVEIAKKFGGEIISADSRQVYRWLNIGTDKISDRKMMGIPHHLIDIADPRFDIYTAGNFVADAKRAIADVLNRGKIPIVAGGTMFYIDALMGKVFLPEVMPKADFRQKMNKFDANVLFERLRKLDGERALQLQKGGQHFNKQRLIRSLEIVSELGKVPGADNVEKSRVNLLTILSSKDAGFVFENVQIGDEQFQVLWICLKNDTKIQRRKIEIRNEMMLKNGLIDEIKFLRDMGITKEQFARFGFEYKYPAMYLEGMEIIKGERPTPEHVLIKMNSGTWKYAKKQRKWWEGRKEINFVKPDNVSLIVNMVNAFIKI